MWFDGSSWKITDKTGGENLFRWEKRPLMMTGRAVRLQDFI